MSGGISSIAPIAGAAAGFLMGGGLPGAALGMQLGGAAGGLTGGGSNGQHGCVGEELVGVYCAALLLFAVIAGLGWSRRNRKGDGAGQK